jgi:HPt (histidine-containing phosphotransfer) domain-containing protein
MAHINDNSKSTPSQSRDGTERAERNRLALVDFDVIQALAREVDAELVVQLLEIFFEQGPEMIGRMKEGCRGKQPDMIRRAAHTMKSSSAMIGAMGVAALCADLETRIRLGKVSGMAQRVTRLEQTFRQTCRVLRSSPWVEDVR